MKKNLFDWTIYTSLFVWLLIPICINLNVKNIEWVVIPLAIILGLFAGMLNDIRRKLDSFTKKE